MTLVSIYLDPGGTRMTEVSWIAEEFLEVLIWILVWLKRLLRRMQQIKVYYFLFSFLVGEGTGPIFRYRMIPLFWYWSCLHNFPKQHYSPFLAVVLSIQYSKTISFLQISSQPYIIIFFIPKSTHYCLISVTATYITSSVLQF